MTRKSQIGDYSPDEESRAKALSYWRTKDRQDLIAELEDQVEQFIAHHAGKGTLMQVWPMVWKTWYMTAVRFNKKPQNRPEPRKFREDAPSYRPSFKATDYEAPPASNLRPVSDILRDFKRR